MADPDGPGREGALRLAYDLSREFRNVWVCVPPAKDVRQWKIQGARRIDVLQLITGTKQIKRVKGTDHFSQRRPEKIGS